MIKFSEAKKLERWLNSFINDYSELMSKFDKARSEANSIHAMAYFMEWNSVALAVATAKAKLAIDTLHLRGSEYATTDDLWLEVVKTSAHTQVVVYSNPVNLASRSTSPASNTAEDASKQF